MNRTRDTNSITGIQAECHRVCAAVAEMEAKGVKPIASTRWAKAAAAMVAFLRDSPLDDLQHLPFSALLDIGRGADPEARDSDLFHGAMMMAGGWAHLVHVGYYYELESSGEIRVDNADIQAYRDGQPRHPLTGVPCPDFGVRTGLYCRPTDKLLALRRFDPAAPVATRSGFPARIVVADRDGRGAEDDAFELVALYDDGSGEGVLMARLDGSVSQRLRPVGGAYGDEMEAEPSDLDLVNVSADEHARLMARLPARPAPVITVDLSQRLCTRDRRRVRLLCADRRDDSFPILALWSIGLGCPEHVLVCGANGAAADLPEELDDYPPDGNPLDLMAWSTDPTWKPSLPGCGTLSAED